MRAITHPILEATRERSGRWASDPRHGNNGMFHVRAKSGVLLRILANDADACPMGWEHVSVSSEHRCPSWEEMCFVKDLFWNDDEVVFQLHPAKENYVNRAKYCLHMWRNAKMPVPLPPREYVG